MNGDQLQKCHPSLFVRVTSLGTSVFVMGFRDPCLYHFDVAQKLWSRRACMGENPGQWFSITAGNSRIYVAGGDQKICSIYNPDTDSWGSFSSGPALRHELGALIFWEGKLLLLGGRAEIRHPPTDEEVEVEEFNFERGEWALAGYKLRNLYRLFAFSVEITESEIQGQGQRENDENQAQN